MYRLSSQERAVLGAVELNADLPIEDIARQTKLRTHSVQYYLAKLAEKNILGPRRASIDKGRLGYSHFHLLFSFTSTAKGQMERFLDWQHRTKSVTWCGELGGSFRYGMSVRTKSIFEANSCFASLRDTFRHAIVGQQLGIITAQHTYGRKYLGPKKRVVEFASALEEQSEMQPDQTDLRILEGLSTRDYGSERELAKLLGLPATTVRRRISEMESRKIILGYYRHIDSSKFGYQTYKLLVTSKSIDSTLLSNIRRWASLHKNVAYFLEILGAWQAELIIEVEAAIDASRIATELQDAFNEHIDSVNVVPIFRVLKERPFPELGLEKG